MHLGPFGCVMKLVAKRAELVQKFVPRSRVKIFRNDGTRSTPLDPKLMFFCVSYYLTRSRVRIFRNESTLSTRLDSKLIFWYISYNLGAFGTVWLCYETRSKTGRTSAKVCAPKSRRNFSQRRRRIHPIGACTDVLVRLVLFGCIWDSFVALQNSVQNGPNSCKSSCHEVASEFFATNAPDPPHWTLINVLVHFVQFWCIWDRLVDL